MMDHKDTDIIYTVKAECHHHEMKACWNLVTPRDAKIFANRNGQWNIVIDKTAVDHHDYLRIAFYDEEPSETFRVRVPVANGRVPYTGLVTAYVAQQSESNGYIEYAIRVLFDGTVIPGKHDGN